MDDFDKLLDQFSKDNEALHLSTQAIVDTLSLATMYKYFTETGPNFTIDAKEAFIEGFANGLKYAINLLKEKSE